MKALLRIFVAIAALWAMPAFAQIQGKTTSNQSAVIATGNTFQTLLAADVNRQALTIENNNTADNCWIFIGSASATAARSILLLPGGSYARYFPFVPTDVIQGTCATAADTIYVDTPN